MFRSDTHTGLLLSLSDLRLVQVVDGFSKDQFILSPRRTLFGSHFVGQSDYFALVHYPFRVRYGGPTAEVGSFVGP